MTRATNRLGPAAVRQHLDHLAKPPGSLGRLEDVALRLSVITGSLTPATHPRRLVLFAADHGVVAEGVTAWPSAVTGVMIGSILRGGAACNVLAANAGAELHLVDVGASAPPHPERPDYRVRRLGAGSANLAVGPALTPEQFHQALALGAEEAQRAHRDGMAVVLGGELGIGNTTAASCLAALLANVPLDQAVGRGAGADDSTLSRKRAVVASATARARDQYATDPRGAIAAVAGLEIAALAGFFLEAHRLGLPILLDGMIATAGALIAEVLAPGTAESLIAAHRSAEPAHGLMLDWLGLSPILDGWALRLGEGTGALLALPMLDAAAAILLRMDTLTDLGISPAEATDAEA